MKIHVFALGGLGENGKNMYCVDIDGSLFILDAGIKYPASELYGVDEIIPDYRILLSKKDSIKGFFMSHAHEDHIAALPHMLRELQAPVYSTNFTMEIIKDNLLEKNYNLNQYELNIVDHNTHLKFGDVTVSFFKTTHSIPESVGVVLKTPDGAIFYTSDFTFDQSDDVNYQTDFRRIAELAADGVLLLMTESISSELPLDGRKTRQLDQEITKVIATAQDRIIVSLFSSDLQKIQRVIDIALKHDKRIAIIGRKAQRIVDIAIESNYLSIPKDKLVILRYIDDKNKNDDPDLVCLVTGDRHEPFHMLNRMVTKSDRLIHITEDDTILMIISPIPGTEKMAAKTLDTLYRTDATVHVIDKAYLTLNHATSDEIKMMINLTKPKYIMPVIGEYRKLFTVREIAKSMGYEENDVFLLDNGDLLQFDNSKPTTQKNRYRHGDILIDGSRLGDVNDIVIHDREMLADNGVFIITAHIDPLAKALVGNIDVSMKGFLPEESFLEIKEELFNLFKEKVSEHLLNKYVNWNDLKNQLRDEIGKFLFAATKRRPVIVVVLISTEQGENDKNIQL